MTKARLIAAIKAMPEQDDEPLEALMVVNLQRDDDKWPLQTLFLKKRDQQAQAQGGRARMSRPRAADRSDDDIPF